MDPELRKQLKAVDWLRVAHRASTLFRLLRGDRHVDHDTTQEKARALQMHGTIESIARNAVGCTRDTDCDCPICTEEAGLEIDENG